MTKQTDNGEQRYTDLTELRTYRRGQWVVEVKVVSYKNEGSEGKPVLNILKRKIVSKTNNVLYQKVTVGEMFWAGLFGREGIVTQTLEEYDAQRRKH